MGLSLRSANECRGRPHQQTSAKDRCGIRAPSAAHGTERRIYGDGGLMRSSALSLALGYVALGIASLVLFAAPLWYAWQVTIQDGRSEILHADAQRLTD